LLAALAAAVAALAPQEEKQEVQARQAKEIAVAPAAITDVLGEQVPVVVVQGLLAAMIGETLEEMEGLDCCLP
jgi:hypothetical protein